MRFLTLFALAGLLSAEQAWEDSPALTSLWQATSSGSTEGFISALIQNREYAQHRSGDGRGPVFWAYEFKNVDTLALLMHLGVELGASLRPHVHDYARALHAHVAPCRARARPPPSRAPSRSIRSDGAVRARRAIRRRREDPEGVLRRQRGDDGGVRVGRRREEGRAG